MRNPHTDTVTLQTVRRNVKPVALGCTECPGWYTHGKLVECIDIAAGQDEIPPAFLRTMRCVL